MDKTNNDFLEDISKSVGESASANADYKFGYSTNVTTTEQLVWDGGTAYPFQEAPVYVSVVSTSENDIETTGTGTHDIIIYGLDANWNLQEEIVDMNGVTPVNSVNTWFRIFRVVVRHTGTLRTNAGDISVYLQGDANTKYAVMKAGNSGTLMALYSTPVDKKARMTQISFGTGKGKSVMLTLRTSDHYTPIDPDDKHAKQSRGSFEVYEQTGILNFPVYVEFGPKTDIWIAAKNLDAGTTSASAGFQFILEDI